MLKFTKQSVSRQYGSLMKAEARHTSCLATTPVIVFPSSLESESRLSFDLLTLVLIRLLGLVNLRLPGLLLPIKNR